MAAIKKTGNFLHFVGMPLGIIQRYAKYQVTRGR